MYRGFSFVLGLSSSSLWLFMPSPVLLLTMLGHHLKSGTHFADHLMVRGVPPSHQTHWQAYPNRLLLWEFHLVSVFLQVYRTKTTTWNNEKEKNNHLRINDSQERKEHLPALAVSFAVEILGLSWPRVLGCWKFVFLTWLLFLLIRQFLL